MIEGLLLGFLLFVVFLVGFAAGCFFLTYRNEVGRDS